jgi:mannose-6-phosphate isomerase
MMQPLAGRIRAYAWGSRTALAQLTGRPQPSTGPEAELWFGAHPDDPSALPDGSLLDALAADPDGLLGTGVVGEFGARLPYLLKVLAAESNMSLQAHPDAAQAAVAYDARHPGYTDRYHKPELLVALDEFDALCGFRDPSVSAEVLAAMRVPALAAVVDALRAPVPVDQRLRRAVELLMEWPVEERLPMVAEVAAAGEPLAKDLGERYPGDVGVVVALLLNRVRLSRDDAVFMPAGNLHTYLCGLGVEVMAASDNVLRGGLTPKRVDVPELLRVLRFEVLEQPVVSAVQLGPGVSTWPVPVREFALYKATLGAGDPAGTGPVGLPATGPRVVLCVTGAVSVSSGAASLPLTSGGAVFVGAGEPPVEVSGAGTVFQVGVAD